MHLEEDTGKSLHVGGATGRIHGADHSLVDYNRAGIPLVEIVTKPIAGTGANAPEVGQGLRHRAARLLRALGVSDVRMEQGSLRCDVNVSLAPPGAPEWGTRTETKNVNSLRSVERAVRYEMRGRPRVLDAGGRIMQETRHFHEDTGTTSSGPEQGGGRGLPVLPRARPGAGRAARGLGREAARHAARAARPRAGPGCGTSGASPTRDGAVVNAGALDLVAATVAAGAPPADARKWWLGELARRANDAGVELAELPVTPAQVAQVVALVAAGTINDQLARQVLDGVLAGEGDPARSSRPAAWPSCRDDGALAAAVDAAIAANPDVAEKVRGGKVQAVGALVGAVMKTTRGKADAARVRELILERLSSPSRPRPVRSGSAERPQAPGAGGQQGRRELA